MRSFEDVHELLAAEGADLGATAWREVTQPQVDAFADTTDDHQWIHVDPGRAAAGPYGGTIAHGMLTLSLVPVLVGEVVSGAASYGLHYGFEKVRFPAPVPVGSKVRARVTLKDVEEVAGGLQNTIAVTIEREGGDKPVCIAEPVYRYYGA